jgi:putative endonuclease
MYFVYFLKSTRNNKIYVGSTGKLPIERLKEHNIGTNVWTKSNKPFELKYFEQYFCKTDALKRERFYKTGFGRKIRDIIIKET